LIVAATAAAASPPPSGPKTVRFARVEIREHPRILGDNPSVKRGPALSLGWFNDGTGREYSCDIDTYEAIRAPLRCSSSGAAGGSGFVALPGPVRRRLLVKEAGVSETELHHARLEISKIKRSRRQHNVLMPYDDTVCVVESCLQTVQGLFQTGSLVGRRMSDWELAKLMDQTRRVHEQKQQQQLQQEPLPPSAGCANAGSDGHAMMALRQQ
jgi:hypothetical protein